MQTQVISTMQPLAGQVAGAANKLLVANDNSIVRMARIDGYMNGVANTQYWLQFFCSTAVPADTTVPLFELQVVGVNGFSWDFANQGGLDFRRLQELPDVGKNQNLIIAVSSTSGVLTASAATMNCEVTIEDPFTQSTGEVDAGDLVTAVKSLNVWADHNNDGTNETRRLMSGRIKNNIGTAATLYAMLFAHIPVANEVPLAMWAVADGTIKFINFGVDGRRLFSVGSDGTVHDGCTIAMSTDPTKFVAIAGNSVNIRAKYI